MKEAELKTKIKTLALKAKKASYAAATLKTQSKNQILKDLAKSLKQNQKQILSANQKDIKAAEKKNLNAAMLDRLLLNEKRIEDMIQGLQDVQKLKDPVGEVLQSYNQNRLQVKRVRIPLGVICMIYESRPNVTIDAAALCLKSGNAVVLRGGSEAFHSNQILVKLLRQVLKKHKVDENIVTMIPFTDRNAMKIILSFDDLIDIAIPRGGERLMAFMKEHSKVPVIKHDKGVCSLFVDESANLDKSLAVILNAKVQRPGVCNALETLYVHQKILTPFLQNLLPLLQEAGVEVRADEKIRKQFKGLKKATDKDWGEEYLDLILSIKTVKDVDEAIQNILKYSSRHTDGILTNQKKQAEKFVNSLDSSCVTINTSTRFNDGGQLGLGAEIGISTTKLHAYGPMGLRELTTSRFQVESDYKIRS